MRNALTRVMCLLCLAVAAAVLFAALSDRTARAQTQGALANLTQNEAIRLLRMINTAELDIFNRTQSYAPLAQVLDKLGTPQGIKLVDSSMGTLRGYSVSVVVSADGKHYVSAIVPLTSGCGFSAFSRGEVAVIHLGTPLGCPAYQE